MTIGTDPDFQTERLGSRLDELKRRFHDAKLKLDVRAYIADNPWRAIALGLVAGVVLGSLGGRHEPAKHERGKVAQAAIAGLSALGMSLLKEVAGTQLKAMFDKWQAHRAEPPASPYAG